MSLRETLHDEIDETEDILERVDQSVREQAKERLRELLTDIFAERQQEGIAIEKGDVTLAMGLFAQEVEKQSLARFTTEAFDMGVEFARKRQEKTR